MFSDFTFEDHGYKYKEKMMKMNYYSISVDAVCIKCKGQATKSWFSVSQALFFKKRMRGAQFFFYCVRFFSCFPVHVDSNVKDCIYIAFNNNIFREQKDKIQF